jgi:hypothetical protein
MPKGVAGIFLSVAQSYYMQIKVIYANFTRKFSDNIELYPTDL